MAFTGRTCTESGVWEGRCHHPAVTVHEGERFPDCPGCRRGIEWHLVHPERAKPERDPRGTTDDWSDEGWWPGKPDGPGGAW
jgi:hypothetical protein